MALLTLVALAYVGWKLYNAPFMRHTGLYALGSLLVFWFSASGGMYNIIRGMPLYTYQNNKVVWWLAVSATWADTSSRLRGMGYCLHRCSIWTAAYG